MQPINMIMIYDWDKNLKKKKKEKEKKKRFHVLEADIIIIKNIDLMPLAQRMHFLPGVF